jgi:hypothetical protein
MTGDVGLEKKKKQSGYTILKKLSDYHFKKWGEYMKRAQLAERKVDKLKALILLVDPAVSNEGMNELSAKQWNAFIEEYPDERG